MTAEIRYTVKYHSLPVKKISNVVIFIGVIILVLLDLIWLPFGALSPEMQVLASLVIIPKIYWKLHLLAFLFLAVGGCVRLLRWRTGTLELTEEKLIIAGSYHVSIWLKNIWKIDFNPKWKVRLDSNVDAVDIKFRNEKEYVAFTDKLIKQTVQFDTIRFNNR